MPSATNATATHANATAAAATATGSGIGIVIAPSKTGALAPTFAGSAAGRSFVGGDVVAVAVAAVVGSMLLLL